MPPSLADELPVRMEGVTKRYGRRTVLDDVTLEVPPGLTGLVGPNGAGKSTLVRAMLGLVRRESGRVAVFGMEPEQRPREVRRLVGVVPEDDCMVPGLSGVEMVQYAARLCGLARKEALRRAHEVLDWCDAGQERYRAVETLSVGTRQKVTFAAALVHDPTLVILDEPTNGLDPLERRAMLGRLVALARDHGKTVFVSTHVLRDVQAICDRVIVLAGGRVRLAGPVAALTGASATTLRLEGTGPLAALVAALESAGVTARPAGDGAVLVEAARPEEIRELWRAAAAAGVVITALEPASRPLEEVFLGALDADRPGGGASVGEVVHAAP